MAGQSGRRHQLKFAAVLLGVIITVLLGSTAFVDWDLQKGHLSATSRFSPTEFLHALGGHLGWLAVFAVLTALMLPLRAVQWQSTLEKRVPFRERFHFVNLGAAIHNLIPGNMGDVTRAFLLARIQKLPFVVGLGSVAICKLLEFAAVILLSAAVLLLPVWEDLSEVAQVLRAAVWTCAGLVLLTVLLAHLARPLSNRVPTRKRWNRLRELLRHVNDGLGTARSMRGMFVALAWAFPPNLSCALAYGIGLEAIGVEYGLLAGPVVMTLIALGKGTPGMPTGPGMYFLVTSWIARALGASPADAAAYALLTNIATGVAHVLPGLVTLAVRRIRWPELRAQTTLAAQAAREVKEEPPSPRVSVRPVDQNA